MTTNKYIIPKTPHDDVIKVQNVSRETFCNFITYGEMLEKWNAAINLVGKSTLPDFWPRHLLDSLQLYRYIDDPENQILADFGSGAGFPGMVLAMAGVKNMHLIESDSRKCAFLAELAAKTGTKIQIHNDRIENCLIHADIVTARALAPLPEIIKYAKNILNPMGKMLLLKGAGWPTEVDAARAAGFTGTIADYPSETDAAGRVLVVTMPEAQHA
jgi:16S rRNA (guanine527-N7)-methyltransferase